MGGPGRGPSSSWTYGLGAERREWDQDGCGRRLCGRVVTDAMFADRRLAAVYDTFEGDRADLDLYVSLVAEFGGGWISTSVVAPAASRACSPSAACR